VGRGAQRTKANNYNLLWLKQKELVCDESSALIFSPPCGSCSVFEVAHTVYKNALNECSLSACAKGAHTKQTILRNCGKSFYPCSN